MARDWHETRAEAVANGLSEERIAQTRSTMEDEIRAYLLCEVRKDQHVTQVEIAKRIGIGQPRISQIERGRIDRTEISTLRAYVEALGGHLEISATFGERRMRIA